MVIDVLSGIGLVVVVVAIIVMNALATLLTIVDYRKSDSSTHSLTHSLTPLYIYKSIPDHQHITSFWSELSFNYCPFTQYTLV